MPIIVLIAAMQAAIKVECSIADIPAILVSELAYQTDLLQTVTTHVRCYQSAEEEDYMLLHSLAS